MSAIKNVNCILLLTQISPLKTIPFNEKEIKPFKLSYRTSRRSMLIMKENYFYTSFSFVEKKQTQVETRITSSICLYTFGTRKTRLVSPSATKIISFLFQERLQNGILGSPATAAFGKFPFPNRGTLCV